MVKSVEPMDLVISCTRPPYPNLIFSRSQMTYRLVIKYFLEWLRSLKSLVAKFQQRLQNPSVLAALLHIYSNWFYFHGIWGYQNFPDDFCLGVNMIEPDRVTIDNCNPSTKEDFTQLEELISEKFARFESSPHYDFFLESLFRNACLSSTYLSSSDFRSLVL